MKDEELVAALAERRTARLTGKREAWARRNPIASDLADCGLRYQVMALRGWALRPPPDERGASLMENGTAAERTMLRQLEDEGWTIVEQQAPFEIFQPVAGARRRVLSGKMDGKLSLTPTDGGRPTRVPFDTKDTSEWNLEALETEEDLKKRSRWTRKWWRQLQAYMLGENEERALLILGHRGLRRAIAVRLDYEEAERILLWCVEAVAADQLATEESIGEAELDSWLTARGVPYSRDPAECATCPYRDRLCHPPDPAKLAPMALRPELEGDVARLLELNPLVREAERIKRMLKEETEGCATVVAGKFIGSGAVRARRMKAQPAKPEHVQEYWEIKWAAPGAAEEEE